MGKAKCTVKGCDSVEKKLFRIPKDCSEEWRECINYGKPLLWKPKKRTVICELHSKSTDFSGPGKHHLLPQRYHKDVGQIFPLLIHYPQVRILRCLKTLCLLYLISLLGSILFKDFLLRPPAPLV